MTLFDRYDQMASRAVDAVNSIPFLLVPMKGRPNGKADRDSTRAEIVGRGVLSLTGGNPGIELGNRTGREQSNDLRLLRSGKTPTLSVDLRQLGGVKPRRGDRIEILEDGRTFEVVSAQPDGHSRIVLVLVGA